MGVSATRTNPSFGASLLTILQGKIVTLSRQHQKFFNEHVKNHHNAHQKSCSVHV